MSKRAKYPNAKRGPQSIDVIAGRNLRILRCLRGYTQERLASEVGISFQQIQKYEKGNNRISLSRAYEFASILGGRVDELLNDIAPMPSGDILEGPKLGEWLLLYTRAHEAGLALEIMSLAARTLETCEALQEGWRSACQLSYPI